MQLLVKRSQGKGMFGRPIFRLWARFELTEEETYLVNRYCADGTVLSEGDRHRDLTRGFKYAIVPAILLALIAFNVGGVGTAVLVLIIGLAGGTYGIYHQIREEIRVSDILTGRFFRCGSVETLLKQEDSITYMAGYFRRLLEAMKNWGGTEIIPIELPRAPVIELPERPHAVA